MPVLFKNIINLNRYVSTGNPDLPYMVFPDSGVCECVNVNNNPSSYQDHTSPTWDFYTYAPREYEGINCPSVAPNSDPYPEKYAVFPNGINQSCWINTLLRNPPQSIPISAGGRGFGASYFTRGFTWIEFLCIGDYNDQCVPCAPNCAYTDGTAWYLQKYFEICPGGIETARKKIGYYGPNNSAKVIISPRHVLLCGHCVGEIGDQPREDYFTLYDPNIDSFRGFAVKTVEYGNNGGLDIEWYRNLFNNRDVRIAELINPDETFPYYFQQYLNPYSYKNWLINTQDSSSSNGLVSFFISQHGSFFLGEQEFKKIRNINGSGSTLQDAQPNVNIGNRYEEIIGIPQPKQSWWIKGDSGTSYFHYTKDGNVIWPGGSMYGQYWYQTWFSINGKFLVDEINQYLGLVNQPLLTEYTDFQQLYTFADFNLVPPEGSGPTNQPIIISSNTIVSKNKYPLEVFPYLSRKAKTQNKNYTYLAFKPGILLQSSELNELQENLLLQNSLTTSLVENWPIFGKEYQFLNDLDFTVYEQLSGKLDEVYEFPIPNQNYCISQKPSQINISSIGSGLYITISEGWYNVPVRDENVWCYLDQPQTILLNVGSTIDAEIYVIVNEQIVPSSFNSQDEGYEFHDKSNRFLNPITDGADRVKVTLQLTEFPENGAVPILRVRKNTDTFISSNRILVQSMNKYKIFDINN
jgi:hypothetical protein